MLNGKPLGQAVVEMTLDNADFLKGLTRVNKSIKSAEKEMKANLAVMKSADDKYGELSKKVEGLTKVMTLNEKRIEQLKEKREKLLLTEKESSESVQKLNNEINNSIQKQASWEKQLKDSRKNLVEYTRSTKDLEKEYDQLKKSTEKNVDTLKKSGQTYDAAKAKLKGLSDQSVKHQEIVDTQKRKIDDLTREFGANSKEVNEAKVKYRELVREQNELTDSVVKLDSKLSKVSPRMGNYSNKLGETSKKLENTSKRLQKTGENFTSTGQAMTSTFSGMALVGGAGIGYAIKQAADFEQAMANVKSLMNPTEWKQYGDSLTDLVKQLGVETKYSNKEVALGAEELIKAGVDLESVMGGGLKSALTLATAGELELAEAAEIAATVLNAFRDDNLSMADAADLLAGSANASASSVKEMNYSLSQVASVAGPLGISFKDTNASLAVFAQNGLKGSDAGTSLKTMLMRLSPQTDAASAVMSDLGIATNNTTAGYKFLMEKGLNPTSRTIGDLDKLYAKLAKQELGSGASKAKLRKETDRLMASSGYLSSAFFDENGSAKSMNEIFGILHESTKNLSNEQKQNAFNTIFGSDAIRGAMIAAKEGSKGFDQMGASIEKISAEQVAEEKMNTLKGSIERMTGEIDSAASSFGEALIPAIKVVAETIEGAVGWFNKLDDSTKSAIAIGGTFAVGLTVVGAGLGFISIGIGGAITGLMNLLKIGGKALGWLSKGSLSIGKYTTNTRTSTMATRADTIALNTNSAALARNNSLRKIGIGGKGRANKSDQVMTTTVAGKNNLGKVGKDGLLKVGKNANKMKYLKGAGVVGGVLSGGALAYDLFSGTGTGKSIGGSVGNFGGMMGGAAAGAAIGSVVPVVGTAIGGIAGSIIGGIVGEKAGSAIGGAFDKQKKLREAEKKAEKGASLNLKIKGVSESTRTALAEYDKLHEGAKVKLNQLMSDNSIINAKIKNDTVKQFTTMNNSVVASTKKKHAQQLEEAKKALASNKNLTQKEKDDALNKLRSKHSAEIKSIKSSNNRVNQILENARKQKRALTTREKDEITKINNDLYNKKISKTAKGESEITKINRQRMKQRADITTKEMNDTIKKANKEYKGTVSAANKKYHEKVKSARIQYKELGVISKAEYNRIVEDAGRERTDTVVQAKKKKDGVVKHAKDQRKKSVEESSKQKKSAIKNAEDETSGMAKAWSKFTGWFKNAWDWLAGLFGGDKASSAPTYSTSSNSKGGKTNSTGQTQMYAKGTISGSHPGGRAIVGELGPELGYIPNKGYTMLGANGPSMYDLPRGSAVLPHDKTMNMLGNYNFPMYAKGTNDDDLFNKMWSGAKNLGVSAWEGTKSVAQKAGNYVKDGASYLGGKAIDAYEFVSGGAKAAYNKLTKAFGFENKFPKMMSNWTKGSMAKWTKSKSIEMIKEKFAGFDMFGGGDGTISNTYNIYDYLLNIAKKVMSSPLGKGLVITSGHRPGDTYDHGKHNAVDLSGFGSSGGYKAVAKWASKLPGVGYTIGDNTVFGKKYGNGSKPSWATGHMNHVHISGVGGQKTSGGTNQWKGIATKALKMTGNYSSANLNALLYQMSTESGGNAKAINNWDSNAKRGTPSKGLMQVIDPTFKAYAQKGYASNIYDPLSNILASINYTKSRYGSLLKGWRGVGYENGGIINKQHLAMLGEGDKKEVVIPLQPKNRGRSRALDLLAYAAEHLLGNGASSTQTVEGNNTLVEQLMKQTELMQEQILLLTKLVTKNNDIYLDGKAIYDSNEQYKNKRILARNIAKGI